MKFAILKNESNSVELNWQEACRKLGYESVIIDLTKSNWLESILADSYHFLACPSGLQSIFKILYDERINIIQNTLGKVVYPKYEEIILHENKKFLAYWLESLNYPHPKTKVFYSKDEALSMASESELPIVGKISLGASGKGVTIIRHKEDLVKYISKAFSMGLRQNIGPNFKMGSYWPRLEKVLRNPKHILKRIKVYRNDFLDIQRGFIILQEYVPHDFEWRVVKIGNSYFGHKKIKRGDKASGSKGINYDTPSNELFKFVDEICALHGFQSMAFDIFDSNGRFLINEMQCIFGHVQDHICEVNGAPGRFYKKNGQFVFEGGRYNTNLSYDLRLANFIDILKNSNENTIRC